MKHDERRGPEKRLAPTEPPPHHGKPGPGGHLVRELAHRYNSAENALLAVSTARDALKRLEPGPVGKGHGPKEEFEAEVPLNLDGRAVVALRLSLANGAVLPRGLHGIPSERPLALAELEERVKELAGLLTILEGAEFREPESCWAVPLVLNGRIVADLKVSADGAQVVADRHLEDGPGRRP